MAKDAYYFSHDSNARNDEKVIALRMKFGWEGFGIFWAVIEKLRESKDYMCIKDYNIIAFDLRADSQKIKSIIEDFGLFVFTEDGKYFYSERILRNMGIKDLISEKNRENAFNRWRKPPPNKESNATAMRPHSDRNASKVKESKEKESNTGEDPPETPADLSNSNLYRKPIIPTREEVQMAFIQNGGTMEMANKFYDTNTATGWYFKSSPITNFKTMIPGYIDAWTKNDQTRNGAQHSKSLKISV